MKNLLQGAYDLHIHATPDVVPRRQDLQSLARDAARAGMAGILLKSHVTPTTGRCYALNRLLPAGPRFFPTLALNPPVGGINPLAVESFLREGGRVVFMPTYGAANHIARWGAGKPPTAFPLEPGFRGLELLDRGGRLLPGCRVVLELLARHRAVLATGHVSPRESLALLQAARQAGVQRLLVTHPSESVVAMSPEEQKQAVELGAMIEHCFFAVTRACPDRIRLEDIRDQIRWVGAEHVIISSDFGQPGNPPAVEGFAHYLKALGACGISQDEMRLMVADNPRRLLDLQDRDEAYSG